MWIFLLSAALIELLVHVSAFSASGNDNVAVYWGQNSAGYGQKRLLEYCDSDAVDIILLAFMHSFPNWDLNFASACSDGPTTSEGKPYCPDIGRDITYCQSKSKKVLLSIGGASGLYAFTDDSDAANFALTLWNNFAGGSVASTARPFGDAILDGFDLDIESANPTGYSALVDALRIQYATDSSRDYYVSAAPQCFYPDASVGHALANSDFDFAFIQFYNNYCNLNAQFNWDTWQDFAELVSPNKNIKLYIGLPGAPLSAGSGYVLASEAKGLILQLVLDSANFGGISIWDMASSFSNVNNGVNFAEAMKAIVKRDNGAITSSSIIEYTFSIKSTLTSPSISIKTTESETVELTTSLVPLHNLEATNSDSEPSDTNTIDSESSDNTVGLSLSSPVSLSMTSNTALSSSNGPTMLATTLVTHYVTITALHTLTHTVTDIWTTHYFTETFLNSPNNTNRR